MRPCESSTRQGLRYSSSGAGVERGRHDEDLQVGPFGLLQVQRPGQGDVAVEMALVELVEDQRRDAAQLGSWTICRSSTPSVTKRMRVSALVTFSKRIW